jgi:adenine-specific DNA-methyltransferase
VSKDLKNLTKEQLIEYIEELRKQLNNEKFGMYFDRKKFPEEVADIIKNNIPILLRKSKMEVLNDGKIDNILIKGENLHALTALNTINPAEGMIDVIYIDPPYNTGAKDWLYNNDYVDSEDSFRHTKWLNMMEKRLLLAKELLKDSGTIIVAIDHYELFQLGMLMNQIFGEENKYGVITVVHKPEGRQFTKGLNPSNEFYLIYGKNRSVGSLFNVPLSKKKAAEFNLSDSKGNYRLEPYMRIKDGDLNNRENKPNNWYPIYVDVENNIISLIQTAKSTEVYPIYKGVEKSWSTRKELFQENLNNGDVEYKIENGEIVIYKKYREQESIKTHWIKKEYNATVFGTKVLKDILVNTEFNFPKSVYAVIDALKITASKDAVVMDFFAGSGTTGQAVMELNKEDGGNRKFILVTNNENNIMDDVCHPRLKTVITGMRRNNTKYSDGIKTNLRFFEVDYIESLLSKDQSKYNLVERCDGLLNIMENIFDKVKYGKNFNIYLNLSEEKTMGIYNNYYEENSFNEMLKRIEEINVKTKIIYYFSLDNNIDEALENKVNEKIKGAIVKPIPSKIYEIYKRISDDIEREY